MADDDQYVVSPLTTDRAVPVGQTKEADQRHALHVRVKNPGDFPGGSTTNAFNSHDQTEQTIPDDTTEVEAKVGGSRLAGRNGLYIENTGTTTLFVGKTGVKSSGAGRGARLFPGQSMYDAAGDVGVFVVTDDVGGGSFVVREFGVV